MRMVFLEKYTKSELITQKLKSQSDSEENRCHFFVPLSITQSQHESHTTRGRKNRTCKKSHPGRRARDGTKTKEREYLRQDGRLYRTAVATVRSRNRTNRIADPVSAG
ncbi:hypothetical protein J6590_034652 [Homalodisca vitripennis]|nr:hypothetical protein J6590_034652 [Homalodisca vitripennis]